MVEDHSYSSLNGPIEMKVRPCYIGLDYWSLRWGRTTFMSSVWERCSSIANTWRSLGIVCSGLDFTEQVSEAEAEAQNSHWPSSKNIMLLILFFLPSQAEWLTMTSVETFQDLETGNVCSTCADGKHTYMKAIVVHTSSLIRLL